MNLDTINCGDCLEVMNEIPDKSVDMVLCDLPYGVTHNKWDSCIPLESLWAQWKRVLRNDHSVVVLTSAGLFTGKVMMSNPDWFKYKMVWVKKAAVNFLSSKYQPLRKTEDILVFYKKQCLYNPQMKPREVPIYKERKPNSDGSNYGNSSGHAKKEYTTISPTDIIEIANARFEKDRDKDIPFHPTQKPVELGRYLIRSYTKEGDTVLDNTCGAGSFLLAAHLEGRKYLGIDSDASWVKVAEERIQRSSLN